MSAQPRLFDFRNPDYLSVIAERTERLRKLRTSPDALPAIKLHYREHPEDFISDWTVTHDPRLAERGLPTHIPFVLFPRQIELVRWILDRWGNSESGLVEKSRDIGASWLSMAFACTMCLFREGITIGFGSRKEELLDRSGDPSSLFHKGRMFMQSLPIEFRGGWDIGKHGAHMRLVFPQTGSAITGEAGDNIGRGGRTAIFFVDEAAHIERPQLIEASLSATTNCRIDMSSVNGMANAFATKRFSGKIPVFTFSWRHDPRKDDAWYAAQCEKLDPVTVASEIDLQYNASSEGILIPATWVQAAVGAHLKLGIEPTGMKYAALDVADEGVDKNAFAGRHGILLQHLHQWSGKGSDIYQTVVKAFDLCDQYGYERLEYDADGMGSGCRGDSRILNEQRKATGRRVIHDEPFRGSGAVWNPDSSMIPGRLNRDMFANFKAQAWMALRRRFQATYRAVVNKLKYNPDDLISIDPSLEELTALTMELSQPTYKLNSVGKILVEKQPDGMRSPNLADAVMICFQPSTRTMETWLKLSPQYNRRT
jgi:phage terminase large subunit